MKIYLNGVEYKTYRRILCGLGVRFGCLNYEYIWTRTPRFNLEEECSFLDELIVDPGFLSPTYVYDYIDFLNEHADSITFAIELYTENRIMLDEDCAVEIIPWYNNLVSAPSIAVSMSALSQPFTKGKLLKLKEQGSIIHGVNCELPFFDSMNSSTWMQGKRGILSQFKFNKMRTGFNLYDSSIARELIEIGYDLDINKIKRKDWKELAKMNCISWKQYQDYLNAN